MKLRVPFAAACSAFLVFNAAAATTHYVSLSSTNPVAPYTSWNTAATNINDAVIFAASGDQILVTNGIYQTGGLVNEGQTNRLYVEKAVTVQSVNGPAVTVIKGYQMPGTTNGSSAIRCAFLVNGATLSGFTLTNGATLISDFGGGVKCVSTNATVTNCIIAGNAAYSRGGGAYLGTLINCDLVGNSAPVLNVGLGGGASDGILINCLLTGNSAGSEGGGAFNCTLINCTVVSNSSAANYGGTDVTTHENCIVYYNSPLNSGGDFFTNCCTFPLPVLGANNFTNPPQFANLAAGDFHLSAISPCINAGNNLYQTNSTDLDGNARIVGGTVDMGAYEFQSPVKFVNINNTAPVSPFTNWLTAATNIQDAIDVSSAGDFIVVSNGIYKFGGRIVYGSSSNRVVINKAVTVESVNGSSSTRIEGFQAVGGAPNIRCVYLTNGASLIGFTLTNGGSYRTGNLTNEQSGGGVWCESSAATISNCVFVANYAQVYGGAAYQGTFNNCVISNNTTFLNGGGTYGANLNNCVISSNRTVQGFGGGGAAFGTLNNCLIIGNGGPSGGGAWFSTLNNCIVSNNFAGNFGGGVASGIAYNSLICSNRAYGGGGAYSNVLINCILKNNLAGGAGGGGGASQSMLVNCTVVSNTAFFAPGGVAGGGILGGSASNCILYYNSVAGSGSNYYSATINYCCTWPAPTNGIGNITNEPAFVDLANGDFHLQSNSPCINSGNNSYVTNTTDFDGNPRISGGTVDIGAYEFQSPQSIISYAWLQQYNLPMDGSADAMDSDGDGFSNAQEWRTGTNPTNSTSFLQMGSAIPASDFSSVAITWQSVSGINYFIQRGTDLSAQPIFMTIATNIVGQAGTTSFTDISATNSASYFYRVGVQ